MPHPAAVEVALTPEKTGVSAHTATGPCPAAAMAPVFSSARSALDKVRVLFKQHYRIHYSRTDEF